MIIILSLTHCIEIDHYRIVIIILLIILLLYYTITITIILIMVYSISIFRYTIYYNIYSMKKNDSTNKKQIEN